MAGIDDDIGELSVEETELKKAWERVIRILKKKGDLAYIWLPEVKKKFLDMETSAERVEFVLEKLREKYRIDDRKELADVELLCRNLDKIKANRKFLKLIHEELNLVIADIEKLKSRRQFLKGLAIGSAATIAASIFGKGLFNFGKRKLIRETTEAFLRAAKDARCLLFGEIHDWDELYQRREDNEYVKLLLPELKKFGFSVFGIEVKQRYKQIVKDYLDGKISEQTIINMNKELKPGRKLDLHTTPDDYVSPMLVMLIRGPGFHMIRYAKNLGYDVVCIDAEDESSQDRENQIFNNIISIIEKGKKVVVFIGVRHINKSFNPNVPEIYRNLGYRLHQKYGDKVISFSLMKEIVPGLIVDFSLPLAKSGIKGEDYLNR